MKDISNDKYLPAVNSIEMHHSLFRDIKPIRHQNSIVLTGHRKVSRHTLQQQVKESQPILQDTAPLLFAVFEYKMNKGKSRWNEELLHKVLDDVSRVLMAQMPLLKKLATEAFQTVFVPKVIARQLVVLVALEAGMVTLNQISALVQFVASSFSSRSRLIRQLIAEQQKVVTQDDWMDLAERIDNIQGNDVWRSDPECALYERERLTARIDQFVHLMRRQDIFDLMFVLRGSIGRNKFGLLHEGLFSKALAGTKVLVETYHNVVCAALDYVCDAPVLSNEDPIPTDARLAFFNETRHSYGRTALVLSGGAALGFYHMGVVKTLQANRLLPRVIGGSSAGSIVCALIATRTDEELEELIRIEGSNAPGHSGELKLNFFRPFTPEESNYAKHENALSAVYHNTAGGFKDFKRTVQGFVPIPLRRFTSFLYNVVTGNFKPSEVFQQDTDHFRECVRASVGNFTFQEAFDRTGRIVNIVVTPNNASDPPRLLNYLTSPHVVVWSAAVASSSLPGVFEANRLLVKEADGLEHYESGVASHYSDGSIDQDLPMQQLSEMFNVNHFIISQANPHAVMFASYNQNNSVWTSPVCGLVSSVINFLRNQMRSWLLHLVQLVGARRFAPLYETQRGTGMNILTQEYEGRPSDISLVPWINHRSLINAALHCIYNPSKTEFQEWIEAAERETWRHIPAIKSHIAEEVTLDRCVQRLRQRLIDESWEKQQQKSVASSTAGEQMPDRVPSFFNSSSLVNLGGLGILDQTNIEGLHNYSKTPSTASSLGQPSPVMPKMIPDIDVNLGWGGRGLHGNHSSCGNLPRTASETSGLFIEDEESSVQQHAGECTEMAPKKNVSFTRKTSENSFDKGYIKTTSMAKFYYRKAENSSQDLGALQKPKSDPSIKRDNGDDGSENHMNIERKKSSESC